MDTADNNTGVPDNASDLQGLVTWRSNDPVLNLRAGRESEKRRVLR
jgi:hypothetical protein